MFSLHVFICIAAWTLCSDCGGRRSPRKISSKFSELSTILNVGIVFDVFVILRRRNELQIEIVPVRRCWPGRLRRSGTGVRSVQSAGLKIHTLLVGSRKVVFFLVQQDQLVRIKLEAVHAKLLCQGFCLLANNLEFLKKIWAWRPSKEVKKAERPKINDRERRGNHLLSYLMFHTKNKIQFKSCHLLQFFGIDLIFAVVMHCIKVQL